MRKEGGAVGVPAQAYHVVCAEPVGGQDRLPSRRSVPHRTVCPGCNVTVVPSLDQHFVPSACTEESLVQSLPRKLAVAAIIVTTGPDNSSQYYGQLDEICYVG